MEFDFLLGTLCLLLLFAVQLDFREGRVVKYASFN